MSEHALRRWRKERGVRLAGLAAEVGVTPSHLSEIERRKNGASLGLVARLMRATGLPMREFLDEREARR